MKRLEIEGIGPRLEQKKGFTMLVLSRKEGERIYLKIPPGEGCEITVTFVRFKWEKQSISLGFDAPKEVTIQRDDIKEIEP